MRSFCAYYADHKISRNKFQQKALRGYLEKSTRGRPFSSSALERREVTSRTMSLAVQLIVDYCYRMTVYTHKLGSDIKMSSALGGYIDCMRSVRSLTTWDTWSKRSIVIWYDYCISTKSNAVIQLVCLNNDSNSDWGFTADNTRNFRWHAGISRHISANTLN